MNIQSINPLSNVNFQQKVNNSHQNAFHVRRLSQATALALLVGMASGCNDDVYEKEHTAINKDTITALTHKPSTIRLTPAERKLERKAQDIAGDYYEVEYLPKEKMLKFTAGDICDNPYFDDAGAYTHTMSNIKTDFGLKNGTILKYNPSLSDVKNQNSIYQEAKSNSLHDNIIASLEEGRQFYSPGLNPAGVMDEAILLPGKSIYIPLKEVGQRLRNLQTPFTFSIFKTAK